MAIASILSMIIPASFKHCSIIKVVSLEWEKGVAHFTLAKISVPLLKQTDPIKLEGIESMVLLIYMLLSKKTLFKEVVG